MTGFLDEAKQEYNSGINQYFELLEMKGVNPNADSYINKRLSKIAKRNRLLDEVIKNLTEEKNETK